MVARWVLLTAALLGLAPGCDRQEPAPAQPRGLVLALGDDLGDRQLADVASIRGDAAPGLRLHADDPWLKRPAPGYRLGRLAMREQELVFAWLSDGQPLLAMQPSFDWDAVDTDVAGGRYDHLVVMPAAQRDRPRGYIVDLAQAAARPDRPRAVLADVVARPMTAAQARDALQLARRVGGVDVAVLDWMQQLADARVELLSVRRVDAGREGDDALGRRRIELDAGPLDDPRALGMLRGEAALTLLALSDQQRPGALARVLADDDAGLYALRTLDQHLPLTEPMAGALVELMQQRLRDAPDEQLDALRVQVTAVLDAIGGHAWELMPPTRRAAAEAREDRRGGERVHMGAAVELAIAIMEHPRWEVQQVGLRMVQRWTEWGWAIPDRQRRRLADATPGLGSSEVREQLTAILEESN